MKAFNAELHSVLKEITGYEGLRVKKGYGLRRVTGYKGLRVTKGYRLRVTGNL
jgi:hypothetical protein